MRAIALLLLAAIPLPARKVDVAKVAAITTITVNVLEIKTRVQQARTAARATHKVLRRAVRKVGGK